MSTWARVLLLLATPLSAYAADSDLLPRNLTESELVSRYTNSGARFADMSGMHVHFRDEGHGPAVILLHGSMQDLYDWDGWVRSLRSRYRIVRFDLPSMGLTQSAGSTDFSFDNVQVIVDQLADRLGLCRFTIVGASFGGIAAYRYAATRPDRVDALVLIASSGLVPGTASMLPPRLASHQAESTEQISADDTATMMRALVADPAIVSDARLRRAVDYARRDDRLRESAAFTAAFRPGQPREELAQISAPVLLLWGGASRALPASAADEFEHALTHARFVRKVVIPGIGHWPQLQDPKDSARAFDRFESEALRVFSGKSTRNPREGCRGAE